MKHADEVLADDEIVAIVYGALAKRHPNSRRRGRRGTPAEVVLRLLPLKHIHNWNYEELDREVRANLCTGTLPASAAARCPMPRRWAVEADPRPHLPRRHPQRGQDRQPVHARLSIGHGY
jgi:hypothetical protein